LNYVRKWKELRNAVAFAVECAKIARPYYKGDRAKDVDHAIDLADRFARGEHVDVVAAKAAGYAADKVAYAADKVAYAAASKAANAATYAVAIKAANAVKAAARAAYAAAYAAYAAADAANATGYAADAADAAAANAASAAAHAVYYATYADADAKAQVTEAFYKWTAIDLGTVFDTEPWHAAMALLKTGNGEAIVKAYFDGVS
jgi:hypothetical protein